MGKPTPGPWKIINGGSAVVGDPENITRTFVAAVYGAGGNERSGSEGQRDNARLISLAPEMAEALRELYDYSMGHLVRFSWKFDDQHVAKKVEALLSRLEGDE